MPQQFIILIVAAVALLVIGGVSFLSGRGSLDSIKSKPVGDGQHGTARWATPAEIGKTFARIPFQPAQWRQGKELPCAQGLVLGSQGKKGKITALVDKGDIHCLMIGASGVGKTAFFLYPNLEYACACGMGFLALDTKGDLARNYGAIAQRCYGYAVSVIDLRNPTRSDGFNFLTLVNAYMDQAVARPDDLAARAKAEKYAKILSKTIISPDGDSGSYGQNAFFYDSAEGLLTAVILLLAEFLPPREIDGQPRERRHIVSVFKLVQDLLGPSGTKGKSCFQVLMGRLPSEHKARWFAGAALNTSEQAMASVLSTVLSRLNAFLDTELEQTICFDSPLDAETFASKKSAIFLILPEEDQTKNFMAGLMIQNLARELFSVADENGGKLKNRVVLFCDELGTMPPFDILPLFSAGRSRRLTLVPIIQSLAQLEKNYGKEGSEIIQDNVQDTIFGGFAPNSQTADVLSKALGSYTVQSGYISRSKGEDSRTLQMGERPLMTPDELKSIPKGEFVVMKTGSHPMKTRLRLFLDWGITFGEPYQTPEHGQRKVYYAGRQELEEAIKARYWLASEAEEKVRPPREGRTGQKDDRHHRQEKQESQPLATIPDSLKKQDGPPAEGECDQLAYYESIYNDQELSHRAKAVYIYLKDHANKEGTCWPGIKTIASGVSLSRSTVKRALDDLVRAGLLEKTSRWRENGSLSSNLYHITFPDDVF